MPDKDQPKPADRPAEEPKTITSVLRDYFRGQAAKEEPHG
jgi:hypothetical protein